MAGFEVTIDPLTCSECNQHASCDHYARFRGLGPAALVCTLMDAELRKMPNLAIPSPYSAERGRRIEGVKFKMFYMCYRLLHFLLTGRGIRVGNFSVLPIHHLNSIVAYPELWNHYAAAIVDSRLPYTCSWPTVFVLYAIIRNFIDHYFLGNRKPEHVHFPSHSRLLILCLQLHGR